VNIEVAIYMLSVHILTKDVLDIWCLLFNATFNNISVISSWQSENIRVVHTAPTCRTMYW
jgi:uncharacterized membrane protein